MKTGGIRALFLTVFLTVLVVWPAGCGPTGAPAVTQSREDVARFCGGVSPGFKGVVAGTDNEFFTATSRQVITLKPDVKIEAVKGRTMTVVAKQKQGTTITCACPAGCSNPVDCVISQVPSGPGPISCSGDCTTSTSCCFGCGWVW